MVSFHLSLGTFMKYLYLLIALTFSHSVAAFCNSEDLTGYWDYYDSQAEYALTCSLGMENGRVSLHRFGCTSRGNVSQITSVSGTLSIDNYCHVTGTLNTNVGSATIIKATMDRTRSIIKGVGRGSQYGPFLLMKFY